MPFELELPLGLAPWKAKIFDLETGLEEPHVTILRRTSKWRISLRTGEPLDRLPSIRDVPGEVMQAIRDDWQTLIREWDRIHPNNPVASND